jgi:energy-coupling factor transporter ATP-binding protein EcfA2
MGRIGSLLEVGTGFHPELTGRENIRLNGAIIGMSGTEIARKFDEIVDFSGVETFIDTPVKRYSSGMQVRLAFAVAAHLEPEILVVDEVLAVGDAEFQKKCLGKMGEIAERSGRTVLFVSHNLSAVGALCRSGVLLDRGEVKSIGDIGQILSEYVHSGSALSQYTRSKPICTDAGLVAATATYEVGGASEKPRLLVTLLIEARKSMEISIGIRIKDVLGTPVGYVPIGALKQDEVIRLRGGRNYVKMTIPAENLATGTYLLSADIAFPNVVYYDRIEDCLRVDIEAVGSDGRLKALDQAWGWGSMVLPPSNVVAGQSAD